MHPIPNYEGLYEISEDGHIWAVEKYITRKAWNSNKTHQILRPRTELVPKKRGLYLAQLLYDHHGVKKFHSIHRLVAETFIPNPNNLPQVNHKDEDKHNNHKDNLEWCTAQDNQIHTKSDTWVLHTPWDEVVEVRGLNKFATTYGLNVQCLQRLRNGRQQQHKGWRLISIY